MQISEFLYIPLITWAIAQTLKFILASFQGHYRPSLLFSSGGMPSVHSATVASLATVALIEGGPASPLFGITGIFAAIVMYDSLGVRRSAGEQAKTLNHLMKDLMDSGVIKTSRQYGHLKEILGHRPLEVVVGALLGVLMAAIFMARQLVVHAPWLLNTPGSTAQLIELTLVGLLVLGALIALWGTRSKGGRWKLIRPFAWHIMLSNLLVGTLWAFAVFLQRQGISGYSGWFIVVFLIGILVFWHAILWYLLLIDGKLRLSTPSAKIVRQDKWLKKAKKRR